MVARRGFGLVGLAVAAATATTIYVAWIQTELGGARTTLVFDDYITTVSPLAGALLCWSTAVRLRGRTASAWGLLGGACAAWAVGNLVWTVYEIHLDRETPFPSLADVGYLALIPLALAGVLRLPGAPVQRRVTIRALLDGMIAAGALLFIGWEVLLGDVYRTSTGGMLQQTIAIAYPVGDVVVAVVALAVLLHTPPGRRLAPALVCAGLVALAVADVSFAYLTSQDSYSTGNPYDTGWFSAFLLVGLGARAQLLPTTEAREGVPPRAKAILRSLPSLTAVVALAVATADYVADEHVEPFLFWTALSVAMLAVVRQLLTLAENADLMGTLRANLAELEARDARLREAQHVARLGSWEWDVVADLVTWSDELYRVFGLEPGQLEPTYEGYLAQLDARDRDRVSGIVNRAYETGEPFAFDHGVASVPGRVVHGRGYVERDETGRVVRMAGTGQDVTEVRRLAAELERRLQELERSNADLARFASVASHDLKTPVQLVSGYLGLLEERCRGRGDDQDLEIVTGAINGTRRMRELIDDILTYSMVAADTVTTDVDLATIAAEAVASVAAMAPHAEVQIGPLPTVRGNASQLHQLFHNLLSNAVSFVPRDRAPRVRVWATRDGDTWRIQVLDNGIGIPVEDRARVFEMFSRLEQLDTPGTGIGLAICHRVVEGHGGRIWIETAPTGGTEVVFTLPAAATEPPAGPHLPALEPGLSTRA